MRIFVLVGFLLIASIGIVDAMPYQFGNFNPVRPNQDSWTCYDHSINYARDNTEYGIVTVSNNPNFVGISHMLNYQIVNDTISFYDPFWCEFTGDEFVYTVNISDRKFDNQYFYPCYYKFWSVDETPLRNYRRLHENSKGWLNV